MTTNTLLFDRKSSDFVYKITFVFLLVVSLFPMLYMSQSAAISGDEDKYIAQAENVYKYFASGGEDKSAFSKIGIDAMYYNGESLDVITYSLTKWFHIENVFEFRHFVNALVSWLVILFTALIALRIWGYKEAILALLLIYLSPRFFGHALNNHRDTPLALSFSFTIYYLLSFIDAYPKFSIKNSILIMLGVASAFSLRLPVGILLSAFVIFFMSLQPFFCVKLSQVTIKQYLLLSVKPFLIALGLLVLAFFLGILIWPYALEAPIAHSRLVLQQSSKLSVSLTQVFEGNKIHSNQIPWYYTSKWILITVPIVVILGWLIHFVGNMISKYKYFKRKELILLLIGIMPIVYSAIRITNDYGAWRHYIFLYPALVLIAVSGYSLVFQIKNRFVYSLILFSIIILMVKPTIFIFKNHPYQYSYYNEIVGGVSDAYKLYETDYSGMGAYGGAEWLKKNIIPTLAKDQKITVASNNIYALNYYLRDFKEQVSVVYSRYYNKSSLAWDYAIMYCGYIDPFQLKHDLWPAQNTVHKVMVDDFVICAVLKREHDEDIKGFESLRHSKPSDALLNFEKYLKFYPKSEEVWYGRGKALYSLGRTNEAIQSYDQALKYYPDYRIVNIINGHALQRMGRHKEAIVSFDKIISTDLDPYQIYALKAVSLGAINHDREALDFCKKAISIKPDYFYSYTVIGDILVKNKKHNKLANKNYDKALQLGGKELDLYAKKGLSYLLHNSLDSANVYYAKMKSLSAGDKLTVKLGLRLLIARGEEDRVVAPLNDFKMRFPTDLELAIIDARIQIARGDYEKARVILTQVNNVNTYYWEARELLRELASKTANH